MWLFRASESGASTNTLLLCTWLRIVHLYAAALDLPPARATPSTADLLAAAAVRGGLPRRRLCARRATAGHAPESMRGGGVHAEVRMTLVTRFRSSERFEAGRCLMCTDALCARRPVHATPPRARLGGAATDRSPTASSAEGATEAPPKQAGQMESASPETPREVLPVLEVPSGCGILQYFARSPGFQATASRIGQPDHSCRRGTLGGTQQASSPERRTHNYNET